MEQALAIFAPLLGKCFAATLSPGITDQHCFTAMYGGAHVRDAHAVTSGGELVYSGETIYSMGPKGAEFTVNSDGGVGHGAVSVKPPSIAFTGTMTGSASAPAKPMSGTWVIGIDGYDVFAEGQPTRRFSLSR